MTTQEFVYRVKSVHKITDGDTYWLFADEGGYLTRLWHLRINGYDTPEKRSKDSLERELAATAQQRAADWFTYWLGAPGHKVWFQTDWDPQGGFGRWLGTVWREDAAGVKTFLGDYLRELGLASIWPKRWHEEYGSAVQ